MSNTAVTARIADGIAAIPVADWDACAGSANPFVGHAFLSILEASGSATTRAGWQPIPIIVDGGIRRGQDVFKALAMGANVCAIGRPILYGLALGGWMGVQGVLEHLNAELVMTMRLAGAKSVADISKAYLNV